MVRVVFLHPDLGIGGAERLIVDCALALQARGHETVILTAHHDPRHAFAETVSGAVEVVAAGDWLPRAPLGRFHALCASLRMLYLAVYTLLHHKAELVVVDQVSTPLPLLSWARLPAVFYCHYPDLLLSPASSSFLRSLYRAPLDWLEEVTTGAATAVLVNSEFTRSVFRSTFKRLGGVRPRVVYPSLAIQQFEGPGERPSSLPPLQSDTITFLSINRFERKKNIGLALRALARLPHFNTRLVVAGGYDPRVTENLEHYAELVQLAQELGLQDRTVFLQSPSDQEKVWLLKNTDCLIYTPAGEHFGIVPLEAMHCGTPVLAVASGGPLETVEASRTGWLAEADPTQFAAVMEEVANGQHDLVAMGRAGTARVRQHFSFEAFATNLDEIVCKHAASPAGETGTEAEAGRTTLFTQFALAFHFSLAMLVLFWMVFYTPLP